ncbi:HlyD family efflux transporter periplasmic adaptor subunit [Sphingomonas sp.]|uniref:HlyD family secretion protein n=1 Tax=Sphingomonas sp. TaxID=28214 RepID=UPI001DC375F8|nr:HlyD family efflux transporter periplasmic adaptor subunit [Sphingomonas sp.]MBX9796960.1 HlyD family secretion protein [Sphingomonas sp.]
MADTLFRKEVIEARRHRLAGTVIAAVPPSSQVYTGIAACVAAVIVAMLVLGSYATTASVRGVVAYDANLARVASAAAGDVRAIAAQPGQMVEAGTPLVTLSTAQGPKGLSAQLAEVDNQIAQIDRQLAIATQATDVEAQALKQQRAGLVETVKSLERQRAISDSQIRLDEQGLARFVRLAKQGAGSQRQVDQARAELLTRRAENEALVERLVDARSRIGALSIQLDQRALDGDKARSVLLTQRAALLSQREDIRRADHVVLAAPVAGMVSDVSTEIGQHIGPEKSLVTIVPRGSSIETWLYAPSNAIGFVRPGQQVRLRFDAYPYQKYGWGRGTVLAVSRAAIDPANVDAAIRPAEPAFKIRVRIDSMGLIRVRKEDLRPGMTLAADVALKRRPLWALLFGPVVGAIGT